MITTLQIKAARSLLNIKQKDLAKKAGISIATLNNIERGAQTDPRMSTMKHIEQALRKEGITFVNDPFEGIGVHLKPQIAAKENGLILIVDDNKADRTLYKKWLREAGGRKYRLIEAENARSGVDAYTEHKPNCILLDFMMYGADGFQLLAALKRDHAKLPPIIFVSAMYNDVLVQTAQSQGVFCCLDKNKLTQAKLITSVTEAMYH
jgi:CheY-like chemotaxis protein/DNA-binding XRE family transcriptional regulator